MNWTISSAGVEKTLADWGLNQVTRKLVSQNQDELAFRADGAAADSTPRFPDKSALVLWRDRILNSDGSFSGGTPWFSGIVIQVPRAGSPDAESLNYRAAGPWWYLDNLVFQQPYQNIFLGYAVAGDPTTAIYGPAASSHLFLNQGNTSGALTKINTGQQIIEALNWALLPFVNARVAPPFQIGTVTPAVDVPIDEVRDITCAEVIHKMLRWSPDAVTWFDYSNTPPTFHCARRADLSTINLDISEGSLIKDINVNARYDLQAPSVQIFYETASSINGQSSLSLSKDFYPNLLPTDPQSQFAALQFTVDLQGIQASSSSVVITTDVFSPADPRWWLARHPNYRPYDPSNPADANNPVSSFNIDASTIVRTANPSVDRHGNGVADEGYQNELVSGQLAPWMNVKSQRVVITVNAIVVMRDGTAPKAIKLSYQGMSTNAVPGAYNQQNVSAYPEPVPFGLAQAIYEAISVLQFEGSLTLLEEEASGSLTIGKLFNLQGGNLAEWQTMHAMVQEVTENLDAGTTEVRFGPPRTLSAGELVDLLRVNRSRLIRSAYSMRAAGSPSDSNASLALGQDLPDPNSSSGMVPSNPVVISNSVDGSGAIVAHASMGADCSSTWISNPTTGGATPTSGSITIKLSDAGGLDLKIQPVTVCVNGVQGSMLFLCSNFIPS